MGAAAGLAKDMLGLGGYQQGVKCWIHEMCEAHVVKSRNSNAMNLAATMLHQFLTGLETRKIKCHSCWSFLSVSPFAAGGLTNRFVGLQVERSLNRKVVRSMEEILLVSFMFVANHPRWLAGLLHRRTQGFL